MLEVGSFLETTASQSLKHETQVPKSRKCRVISMHAIDSLDFQYRTILSTQYRLDIARYVGEQV